MSEGWANTPELRMARNAMDERIVMTGLAYACFGKKVDGDSQLLNGGQKVASSNGFLK